MKKYLIPAMISIVIGTLASCSDDVTSEQHDVYTSNTRSTSCESDSAVRLHFENEEELKFIIQATESDNNNDIMTLSKSLPNPTIPANFVSLTSNMPNKVDGDIVSYYEYLGYDTLVPNPNFARLFNIQGELEVNNDLVKVTPAGTFIVSKRYENDFRTFLRANPDLIKSRNHTTEVTYDGKFKLIPTFKTNQNDYSLVSEGNYTELPDEYFADEDENGNNASFATRAANSEPNFDDFPVFSADRKTLIGQLIQNIIGSTKAHTINFSKNRRIKGSFYFYNYGIYSEIGVKGWTDKKRTIGWCKVASDELRIGWRNVVLRVPTSNDFKNAISQNKICAYYPPNNMQIGEKTVNTAVLIDYNLPSNFLEKAAQYGVKYLIEYIKNEYDSSRTNNINQAGGFLVANNDKAYLIVPDGDITKHNIKSYCHTFSEEWMSVNIKWDSANGVSLNNANLEGNLSLSLIKFLVNIFTQQHTTLVGGEVYVCANINDTWRGMKIKKRTEKDD